MITIKAYSEKNRIHALFTDINSDRREEENVVYSNPIQLYSGVNNPIRIFCLNSDQKFIDASNISIQAGIFSPGTSEELITVNAANVDAAHGLVQINFSPDDLEPLNFGTYEVALTAIDANLNAYPIYINDHYGSRLTTTLSKGPILEYNDPISVNFTDVEHVGVVSDQIDLTKRPVNSFVATLQAQLEQYTGNIISQGTLISIPTVDDWANVSSSYYSNISGNILQNVLGSYAMIRFVVDGIDPRKFGNIGQSNIANVIISSSIRI